MVIGAVVALIILFLTADAAFSQIRRFRRTLASLFPRNIVYSEACHGDEIQLKGIETSEDYAEARLREDYGQFLINSILREKEGHYRRLQEFCRDKYDLELRFRAQRHQCEGLEDCQRCRTATNSFFFRTLGTSDVTETFLDNVDNGWFFRKKKLLRRLPVVRTLLQNLRVVRSFMTVMLLIQVTVYYLDLFKDALLISRLQYFLPSLLPLVLYSVTLASVVLGELANIVTVLNFKGWTRTQTIFGAIFITFVPALLLYMIYKAEMGLKRKAREGAAKEQLSRTRTKLKDLQSLRADLRANENAVEHFAQLVVLALLILIKKSDTSMVAPEISNFLLPDIDYLLYGSALISYLSLVRGQLNFAVTKKDGFVPFLGKLILLAYFAIGTAARLFAFVLFFTPSLGLMDTQHHTKIGSLPASAHRTIFDISNGTVTLFHELWNDNYKLNGPEEFYDFPRGALSMALPGMIALHLVLSWILQKKLYFKGNSSGNGSWTKTFLEQLSFLVCPPVYLDWERILRLDREEEACIGEDDRGELTGVKKYWSRSKALLIAFNVILIIEHFALMVPMIMLKLAIDERNADIAQDFLLTTDEKRSTDMVNFLLFFGIGGFTLLPFVSLLLAFAYNKKGHAWSRILESQ